MKYKSSSITRLIMVISIMFVLSISIYLLLTGRIVIFENPANLDDPDPITLAKTKIAVGDSRESAIDALSDAWFYSECRLTESEFVNDLFFYGPQQTEKVKIVVVRSTNISGIMKVEFIGSLESYMLHLYDYCTPNPNSVFNE